MAGFGIQTVMPDSTSLLLQTSWRNTDHVAGLQQPSTQLRQTYCRCSCTQVPPPAAATCSSLANSSPMTSAGRKHSAFVLRQTQLMPSSFAYVDCRPTAWTFRHTACEKWNAHPRYATPGKTSLTADQSAASKPELPEVAAVRRAALAERVIIVYSRQHILIIYIYIFRHCDTLNSYYIQI